MKNYILFHENCMDGWYSGVITYIKAKYDGEKNIIIAPVQYGDEVPINVTRGDTITLVDFSYPMEKVIELNIKGINICIVDHHKTAIDDLISELTEKEKQDISTINDVVISDPDIDDFSIFSKAVRKDKNPVGKYVAYLSANNGDANSTKSGALTAYAILNYDISKVFTISHLPYVLGAEIQREIITASNYDLWKHNGEIESEETYLCQYFKDFYNDNRSIFTCMKTLAYTGASTTAIFEALCVKYFKGTLVERISAGEESVNKPTGLADRLKVVLGLVNEVRFINPKYSHLKVGLVSSTFLTSDLRSIAGSEISGKMGYDVALLHTPSKTENDREIYSLRSKEGVDVAEIAKVLENEGTIISGGGHKTAAGMTVYKNMSFLIPHNVNLY